MRSLHLHTSAKDQILDITSAVQEQLEETEGVCTVFVAHTTCALATADLDPGTDLDMLEAFRKLLPAIRYRHPHNPGHTPDHILATLLGCSVSVPVHDDRLVLGVWQRVILVELDGPRDRELHVVVR